jgi:hypothetical protein
MNSTEYGSQGEVRGVRVYVICGSEDVRGLSRDKYPSSPTRGCRFSRSGRANGDQGVFNLFPVWTRGAMYAES